MKEQTIYVCSDAVGETAEAVAKATLRQFSSEHVKIKRYGHIKSEDEIHQLYARTAGIARIDEGRGAALWRSCG
jgi:regulator of PEP synthase PpsR (kinase-PPPase family)